jgi:ribokinase
MGRTASLSISSHLSKVLMKPDKNVLLLGGIIIDRYFEVGDYPASGQDALILNSFEKPGGCALNVAVTLNNLGSVPYIVSKLGDDEAGKKIEQYIKALGLPAHCIKIAPGKKTGYCLNIIDNKGERTFFTYKGCEIELSLDMLPEDLLTSINSVYINGYYLLNKQTSSAVLELVERLRQNKCLILFDPGPLAGEIYPSQLVKMISLTDWIIPNQSELEIIQEKYCFGEDPVKWLLSQGCQYVVVKRGADGVDLYSSSSKRSIQSCRVKTIDTTGAGDSFAGGLIHALLNQLDPKQAVELANACGAFTATIVGPHGIFTYAELDNFIQGYKEIT